MYIPIWKEGDAWAYEIFIPTNLTPGGTDVVDPSAGVDITVGYRVMGIEEKKGFECYKLLYWVDFTQVEEWTKKKANEEMETSEYSNMSIEITKMDLTYYGHVYYRTSDMGIVYEDARMSFEYAAKAYDKEYDNTIEMEESTIADYVIDYSDPLEMYNFPITVGDEWSDVARAHVTVNMEVSTSMSFLGTYSHTETIEGDLYVYGEYRAVGTETLDTVQGNVDSLVVDYSRTYTVGNVTVEGDYASPYTSDYDSGYDTTSGGTYDYYDEEYDYLPEQENIRPMVPSVDEGEGREYYDPSNGRVVAADKQEGGMYKRAYVVTDVKGVGDLPPELQETNSREDGNNILMDNMLLILGIGVFIAVVAAATYAMRKRKVGRGMPGLKYPEGIPDMQPNQGYPAPAYTQPPSQQPTGIPREPTWATADDMWTSPAYQSPYPPTCPNCGHTATYISQYQRWYCYNCQRYL